MKNLLLKITLIFSIFSLTAQENQLWKGYFSYNNIKDISQTSDLIYAATENAYFKRNVNTNEVATVSTIEGLSGQNITQIYHSEAFKKTIIGHDDGLIIVVNDRDGSVLNVVDIINKPAIPQGKKRINHLMEYQGKIYIATDYGISIYDLNINSFGDSYFIGAGGSDIEILQTTVFNGFIYAVAKNYGILKADITSVNLIDFNQWTNYAPGIWSAVEKTNAELVAVTANQVYKMTPTVTFNAALPQNPIDLRYTNGKLIFTSQNYVIALNDNLTEVLRINNTINSDTFFTCATIINDNVYIGTTDKGILNSTISNPTNFKSISPKGPDRNRIFGVESYSNGFWAVYGDVNIAYNPYTLDLYNVSKYDADNSWKNFMYSDIFESKSITRVVVNPNNENLVYFSSHFSGLLKFENDVPKILYNQDNSSIQNTFLPNGTPLPYDNRINGSVFDKSGNLWVTNSLTTRALHVLKTDGQWQGYPLPCAPLPFETNYGKIDIDKNGTKWIPTNNNGLIAFNEKFNNKCIKIDVETGNLPVKDVRVVAVDNKNKLWIGTATGLRILSSVDSFLSQDALTTNSIIILEDDVAQELLFEQFITDIAVDGANNKWIGTNDAGVFYISADGQKTFNIFTKENSPLPSNIIIDIDINQVTGEVLIATENGLVSYKGTSTKGLDNLENIVVFPNPVRPDFTGQVAITGLMNKANVKITDIEGNLVHEAVSEGGTLLWDTMAFGKYKVSSGVYMVFASSEDGAETKVKKIMVVR
jgi:ligand-binding sensor domain-containing protein